MLEGLATGCPDWDSCWHPVPTPDGFPFVSTEAAIVWAALLAICLAVLLRRLLRG